MKLYPHQEEGIAWLVAHRRGMLADEQGLGKTITALRAARMLKPTLTLVVCPTVVLWNWEAEAVAWWPGVRVQVISKGKTDIDPTADIVVVTHGLLLRPWILSQILDRTWDVCILDEAHFFKNASATRTQIFYRQVAQKCDRVWVMTGTPCPNHAGELWIHLIGLEPERLWLDCNGMPMQYETFLSRFCYWRWDAYDNRKVSGNRKDMIPELKRRLGGFMLRRTKAQVLKDLPAIRFETIHLRPKVMPKDIIGLSAQLSPKVRKLVEEAEGVDAGFDAMKNDVDFTTFRRLCGMAKIGPTVELLEAELVTGELEKVVVFAHHKDAVEGIAHGLEKYGVRTITGATAAKARRDNIAAFQTDPRVRVIVCNIVAGGTGATLTAASDVVFAEQSWVPGENAQAADRCHRIGQTERVRVRYVTLAGTIDEAITASLVVKTQMIREVLGE